jgi:hypothetical protein
MKIKLLISYLFTFFVAYGQTVSDTCDCSVLGMSHKAFVNPYQFGLDIIDYTDLEIVQGYKVFFDFRY